MVAQWQAELQNEVKVKLTTITTVIKAFNAAMLRATSEDGASAGEYKVEGTITVSHISYTGLPREYLIVYFFY